MNHKNFLKLASIFDRQGKYKTSDLVFKLVQAQVDNLDEDPLGISDIQPTRMKDDPVIEKLRRMVTNGEINDNRCARNSECKTLWRSESIY